MRLDTSFSLLVGLLLTTSSQAAPTAEQKARPNILFIFSDDHAWQSVSAYNSSLIQTPQIDRLAKEGIRFDRCLIPNPLCGPSRATVLTGTHSHINGFFSNSRCTFDGSQITFPKILQKEATKPPSLASGIWEASPLASTTGTSSRGKANTTIPR